VFTADYAIDKEAVYLNGFRLPKADYTADNGTSITLVEAAAVGDDIIIVSFGPITLIDINLDGGAASTVFTSSDLQYDGGAA